MTRVVIESPYAASADRSVEDNVTYAQACLLDSLSRGESPIASHLLYPQVLDDRDPLQRAQGVMSGLLWLLHADLQVFYVDFGYSHGMIGAKDYGASHGIPQKERRLYPE